MQGSVEAVADALTKLSTEKVRLSVIHAAVGAITEGDVNLAIASKAIIIGFNVRPAGKAAPLAEENKIEIRLYSIIYNAVDDVRSSRWKGCSLPRSSRRSSGKAEVRPALQGQGDGRSPGATSPRGRSCAAPRRGSCATASSIWDGKIAALKRFKDDVREVAEGFECGISLEGYNDMKEKDIIECYEIEEVKQKL